MENLESSSGEGIQYFKLFIKSLFVSLLLSLVGIFILSLLVSLTSLKESVIGPVVIFISTISILIGGLMIAQKTKKKGILHGALVGLSYMLLLYVISSLTNMHFILEFNSIIMILFGILGGAIGGIFGVNT